MAYADLKIIAWIFMIQNKQILLLEKKVDGILTWTIPFKTVYGLRHPSEHIQALVKDYFSVEINAEHFFMKTLVHKLNKENKATLWYFPSTITREGELKLNKDKNIEQYDWFSYDELPENMTSDLKEIIKTSSQDQHYLELQEVV